jgi:hypothetical protein
MKTTMKTIKKTVKELAKSEETNFDWLEEAINGCENQVNIDDILSEMSDEQEKYKVNPDGSLTIVK